MKKTQRALRAAGLRAVRTALRMCSRWCDDALIRYAADVIAYRKPKITPLQSKALRILSDELSFASRSAELPVGGAFLYLKGPRDEHPSARPARSPSRSIRGKKGEGR